MQRVNFADVLMRNSSAGLARPCLEGAYWPPAGVQLASAGWIVTMAVRLNEGIILSHADRGFVDW